ncbi:MAG TPA: sugar ABC transporter ATP-binding protein [Candidatus Blautia excrementipullorum]|nr:sugar ABC transporter ATP-binding protein [Candidatus Blautia excrementipullorum]
MQDYLVELKNISKFFPGVKALNDVSLNIRKETVHCIIGENGAGKSTLMKIMSGAYQRDKGTILLEGKELNASNPAEALKAGIGIVYQELNNFGYMDVASNLFVGRIPKKHGLIDYKKLYQDAQELLNQFNMSYIKPTDTMNHLSLGSQQMVEIAKLLSMNVKLMILDEPTSALTDTEVELLYQLIAQVKSKGVSFVYISHKLDEILHLADDITVLKDGEFVDSFPNSPDVTKDDLVRLMVGRDVAYDYGAGTTEIKEEIMKVSDLCCDNNVQDISFTLRRGEILGFAGLEGSGRTETLETIFGWRKKTSGHIEICGKEVHIKSPVDAKKNHMAYITKDRKNLGLFLDLSAEDNMSAANTGKFVTRGLVDYKRITSNAKEYQKKMQIKLADVKQKVGKLSGGNQQKVLLSMWMASEPEIILIDEPTRGIDVGAKAEIHALLRKLVGEGKAVIMVSSEMPEIMASCDRVLVFHDGRITGELEQKDITEQKMMSLASGITE